MRRDVRLEKHRTFIRIYSGSNKQRQQIQRIFTKILRNLPYSDCMQISQHVIALIFIIILQLYPCLLYTSLSSAAEITDFLTEGTSKSAASEIMQNTYNILNAKINGIAIISDNNMLYTGSTYFSPNSKNQYWYQQILDSSDRIFVFKMCIRDRCGAIADRKQVHLCRFFEFKAYVCFF